jgi:hypothetical protein
MSIEIREYSSENYRAEFIVQLVVPGMALPLMLVNGRP